MFFSHICRVLAILALFLGIVEVSVGWAIANDLFVDLTREEALARYTAADTTGQAIDWGFKAILLAIAMGTLAEICFSLRRLLDRVG